MKLYHSHETRSVRPRWLLEEIGARYELVRLDLHADEHRTPEYLEIHPHGVVPALVDGDLVLYESAAIVSYLADAFPDAKLAPPLGTPERGLYYQWMYYSIATLEPPVMDVLEHTMFLPEDERDPARIKSGRENFVEVAAVLDRALSGRSFILGDFSAADIMLGLTLIWAAQMEMLGDARALQGYAQRLSERPAFQRANAD